MPTHDSPANTGVVAAVPPARLVVVHRIDALHLEHPFAGNRMLREALRAEGLTIGRLSGQRRAFSRPTSAAIDTKASG